MAQKQHDDSAITRRACMVGLVASWFVAIGSLIGGGICLYFELRDGTPTHIAMSHTWREIVPLLLNIIGMSWPRCSMATISFCLQYPKSLF